MNVNELFDIMWNSGLTGLMQETGIQGDALAQIEVIVLGTAAVTGILLCLLGLKIVRVWAALTGLASGFTAGVTAGTMLGLNEMGILIA